MWQVRRRWLVGAVTAVLIVGLPTVARSSPPDPRSGTDNPETGIQGRVSAEDQANGRSRLGYWSGTTLIGSNDLGGQGVDIQLTWAGRCAYANVAPAAEGGPDGIAVIDVANPKRPKLIQVIRDDALGDIHEGLHANERRHLLVAPSASSSILGVYDITDCRHPALLSHVDTKVLVPTGTLKDGLHSGKLTPDGQFFYGTNGYRAPCVVVVDLLNPLAPKVVGSFGDFGCHDLDISPDSRRAFVGWGGGEQLPGVFAGAFSRPDDVQTGVRIVDISQIADRQPDPEFRVVGEAIGGRSHTETPFQIGDKRFVIATEEGQCPGGDARIVDVTDETTPRQISELGMGVNRPENCAEIEQDITDRPFLFYTSHYVSVDDPTNASLAFVSWYTSGLRIFDIRNPSNPVEVAYYNPPVGPDATAKYDTTTTYARWDPKSGQIWFGSWVNGFQVIELTRPLGPVRTGVRSPPVLAVPASARPTFQQQYQFCRLALAAARQ